MTKVQRLNLYSWYLLVFLAFILMPVMFHWGTLSAHRINVPYAQYMFFLACLLVLVRYYFSIGGVQKIFQSMPIIFWLTLSLLLMACFLSALLGITPFFGARLLIIVAVTSCAFVLVGLSSLENPAAYIKPFFIFTLVSMLITFITQYIGPIKIGPVIVTNYFWGATRWSGWFNQANGLGVVMALAITVFLYFMLASKNKLYRLVLVFCICAAGFLIAKSGSRTAIAWAFSSIWTVFSIAVLMRVKYQKVFLKIAVVLALLLGLFISTLSICQLVRSDMRPGSMLLKENKPHVNLDVKKYHRSLYSDMKTFTSNRWPVWVHSFDAIKKYPVFGYGFGGEEKFLHYTPNLITGNVYVRLASESGLLSLALFLIASIGALIIALKHCLRYWDTHPQLAYYACFLLMCLVGIGLEQLGDAFILRVEEINYLYFFVIAAAWGLLKYEPK